MNLIDRARQFFASASRRAAGRHVEDPADMGTAFGLDAITTLDPAPWNSVAASEPAEAVNHFQLRLQGRSGG
jgi:hypothetical protein